MSAWYCAWSLLKRPRRSTLFLLRVVSVGVCFAASVARFAASAVLILCRGLEM